MPPSGDLPKHSDLEMVQFESVHKVTMPKLDRLGFYLEELTHKPTSFLRLVCVIFCFRGRGRSKKGSSKAKDVISLVRKLDSKEPALTGILPGA